MDRSNSKHRHRRPKAAREKDPKHESRLDTVAQKPTDIGLGAPVTAEYQNAHEDGATPTPGAQPPIEHPPKLGKAEHVAAGLKAILQGARFTFEQMGPIRGIEAWFDVNKKDGFDCQSCAWPSPDGNRHLFEFCENGAKAFASEATRKHVTADFFRHHSIAKMAEQSDYWLEQQGRLVEPMVKRQGGTHYEPISWEEAFQLLAQELNALPSPDAAVFYTSGRTSNEAAFLYQLFVRQFGTNNLPDCSNMCHESSGSALSESIGIGKGCVTLEDLERAEAIFIIGQNPGTNHPRMLTTLEVAKKNGAKIVAINPLPEPGLMRVSNPNPEEYDHILLYPVKLLLNKGEPISDLWLPVRINGDMAVMRGIMKEMLAEEDQKPGSVFDLDFIRESTIGFDAFLENLRATSWEDILVSCGLTREQIRAAAEIAMEAKSIICCWAMGLTQHKNSVATIQEVMNFLLLRGNIGRPGAGPCPVRGHSNVQGDRTMGIWERMNDHFMAKLGEEFHFTPPAAHGADTVEAIKLMRQGKAHVFFGMGGNFLSATPDTEFTAKALRKCRVTAHVSTKLNRSHLITGDIALILPCLGRSEIDQQAEGDQFVTVEDSMGIINASHGHLKPAGKQLLSEPAIIAHLARATLGGKTTVDWERLVENYDRIREHIEHVIPGFENFNARIRRNVFYLPNDARDQRKFNNGLGKAKFIVSQIDRHELEAGTFLMMTIRSHDQFNTTIYGLDDRYRGVYHGRRVVFMNPEDVRELGLQQGQFVDLTSHYHGEERTARHFMVAPFAIPRGCTATYFPEANVLVPINSTAERSNTPTSKSVLITIAPSPDPAEAFAELKAGASESMAHA
ncbi:oxidoreductase alpha (molybdopterin) subunit [Chthoniobacter flavus Ellin428]|uniref:Oxidoreductase alpha (Molybdopterin) subunit n=1 Tax=Chthoniobacter flavus Ellin428 TaxID=497964 RepID=B4DA18_9BACT|nr:FdhF/YdeP family oxidoreductase [Chthoniobacter flavus]EDY16645.1 oxidoreductase alpha (molybdopterin) subunit [Chthoniobacter flavus Ellin428]TCO87220.1 molybdopterin-dependent oxidoreductase alpha subunit [Chthoniobacter flavus]